MLRNVGNTKIGTNHIFTLGSWCWGRGQSYPKLPKKLQKLKRKKFFRFLRNFFLKLLKIGGKKKLAPIPIFPLGLGAGGGGQSYPKLPKKSQNLKKQILSDFDEIRYVNA